MRMIGSSKRIAIAVVGGLAVSVFGVVAAQGLERTTGIWKVLRDGHFSGPMNEGAHVRPIKGFIAAKDKKYRFWEYSWVNKDSGHGGTGLLVFEQAGSGLTYLGAYDISLDDFKGPVHPVIRGKTVFFPFHDVEILGDKNAWAMSFENGPPKTIPGRVIELIR